MTDNIDFPIRINRYLLLKGYSSRRRADKLIADGKVKINGSVAKLGSKVEKGDKVVVAKSVANLPKTYKYFLFNKPKGIVSNNPQENEKGVADITKMKEDVVPLGRLDKESHGLMLLSDDGRIVDKMLNPKYEHEKEYVVKVDKKITTRFIKNLSEGVDIEGYFTKPAKVIKVNDFTFKIILTEGKRHQIRRMVMNLGYQVKDLKRVRIMNLYLGNLPSGKLLELTDITLKKLLKSLDL
ncbi:MAG: rRNA pseudouridine synthase [Parcubacteria group bacterium]|nr:rRNA pseudouridine synthase [Parcubacteria group bacterium]